MILAVVLARERLINRSIGGLLLIPGIMPPAPEVVARRGSCHLPRDYLGSHVLLPGLLRTQGESCLSACALTG